MSEATGPMDVRTADLRARQRESVLMRLVRTLADSRELTLLVLVIAAGDRDERLLSAQLPDGANIRAVLLNLAPVAILACGMMLLLIGGTFDLSVGSTLALSGVWTGVVVGWWHWPPEVGIVFGILVGCLAGLFNGFIVTRVGINALICTLATMAMYRSLTYVTAGTGVTPISDGFAA